MAAIRRKGVRRPTGAKKAINDAFFELIDTKNIDQITIQEICDKAFVNRQTFYYHYTGIADLFTSAFDARMKELIEGCDVPLQWNSGFARIAMAFYQNKSRLANLYYSSYRDDFVEGIIRYADEILYRAVCVSEDDNQIQLTEEDRLLATRFYRYEFVGILLQYIRDGMKLSPEELVRRSSRVMDWSLGELLLRLSKKSES